MGKLIYSAICSLDCFVNDADGEFGWAMPDEEVHRFFNDLERASGTCLYGRRMYETMAVWDTDEMIAGQPDVVRDFADIWRAADKIVYSRTLEAVSTANTRLEREFDPSAVAHLKSESERELSIGGAELAAQALTLGLVDEVHLVLAPIIVGGGTHALPHGPTIPLELLDTRRFGNGMVHLHYRVGAHVPHAAG